MQIILKHIFDHFGGQNHYFICGPNYRTSSKKSLTAPSNHPYFQFTFDNMLTFKEMINLFRQKSNHIIFYFISKCPNLSEIVQPILPYKDKVALFRG